MKRRGRPILGAISGLLLGLFLGLDLFFFGVIALGSIVITALVVVGFVGGLALGLRAPLGRPRHRSS